MSYLSSILYCHYYVSGRREQNNSWKFLQQSGTKNFLYGELLTHFFRTTERASSLRQTHFDLSFFNVLRFTLGCRFAMSVIIIDFSNMQDVFYFKSEKNDFKF